MREHLLHNFHLAKVHSHRCHVSPAGHGEEEGAGEGSFYGGMRGGLGVHRAGICHYKHHEQGRNGDEWNSCPTVTRVFKNR